MRAGRARRAFRFALAHFFNVEKMCCKARRRSGGVYLGLGLRGEARFSPRAPLNSTPFVGSIWYILPTQRVSETLAPGAPAVRAGLPHRARLGACLAPGGDLEGPGKTFPAFKYTGTL